MSAAPPLVVQAIRRAVEAHGGQLRKDGRTPYIVHPLGVLRHLTSDLRITDPEAMAAAVLHDVLEDTPVPPESVERDFGQNVRRLVEELTLPPDVHGPQVPTQVKTQHIVRALEEISWSGVAIKLCDRWDNLSDMHLAPWSKEKKEGFLLQTEEMLRAIEARRAKEKETAEFSSPLTIGIAGVRRTLESRWNELQGP
ncbi:MAG: bifunctional (p)ppGpp synthetase/guanosine-3',5'-bis(diphosphate) 3'-pyrophosphohydrolase [Euryarchaeota archaeon]|nr:bifunctional (p)ppGpp synthetase/guanosine-3',5'-bis(diphosphate) 3'-pyrophosphohydrolase [Euryarchaeota archaeon]